MKWFRVLRLGLLVAVAAPVVMPSPVWSQAQVDGSSTVTAPRDDAALQRLADELARLEPLSAGSMGIAAVHIETGRAVYLNGDEAFPMASTY